MTTPTAMDDAGTTSSSRFWFPAVSAGRSVSAITATPTRFASMSNRKKTSLNLVVGAKRSADPLSGAASFAQGMVTMCGARAGWAARARLERVWQLFGIGSLFREMNLSTLRCKSSYANSARDVMLAKVVY